MVKRAATHIEDELGVMYRRAIVNVRRLTSSFQLEREDSMANFIFMLTSNDRTVSNALEVMQVVRETGLEHIGFKDIGASPEAQKEITQVARAAGMTVYLECVSTSLSDEIVAMESAVAAGVDWVLGGTFPEESARILQGTGIKFAPFPGIIVGHPSELRGTIREIADHASRLMEIDGVDGVDLLAYRHRSVNVPELIATVVDAVDGPVIVAGSVTSRDQVRAISDAGAWGFTIGSAIFDGALPGEADLLSQMRSAVSFAS